MRIRTNLKAGIRGTYVVQAGDTLVSISKKYYKGNAKRWKDICNTNRLVDCNKIKPGQSLVIPD